MKNYILFLKISLSILLLAGCELYLQDEYQPHYVVESYLVANDYLPQVRLTKTVPIHEDFNKNKMAVQDANVQIHLLNPDNSIAELYQFKHKNDGRYLPADTAVIKPGSWYKLYITTKSGDIIEAKTLIPGEFNIVNKDQTNVYSYRGNKQIEFTLTPSKYPNRQSYYFFTAKGQDTSKENLTPFYKELVQEKNVWINTYFLNSSDISNESKYNVDEQGNILLKIPWSIIAFYGQNTIAINAIDDNLYNYIRSQDGFTKGTTWANGKVQNTRYNIKGGIGIFGSMASTMQQITIMEN